MDPIDSAAPDFTLIAGPCSAETRAQVLATAAGMAGLPLRFFRAGAWKPRTRPGAFEGAGPEALFWLAEVREQYGFPVAVEVADAGHVEAALKAGVDAVWIGARTTVNPFSVQQLADALRGAPVQVLVKNPVIPDADLWLGGIERMERAGFADVWAIHRGFPGYGAASPFRNPPSWAVPIELRRRRPDLKIICDPSHISGNRPGIEPVSQKALDLGFDGLMIETHAEPEKALSDASQQVTPEGLRQILSKLVVRRTPCEGNEQLSVLRSQMDAIDAEMVHLLGRRFDLSQQIGEIKKASGMTAFQPERWREILRTRSEWALLHGLEPSEVADLFQLIHLSSVQKQLRILGS